MKILSILAIAITAFWTSAIAEEPEPLPAEAVKVLKLFVGKSEVSIDNAADLKGSSDGGLVLGDRFVRDEFVLKNADGDVVFQGTTMITYDTKAKVYRMWMFMANGEVEVSEGTWNEGTRTLTTKSRNAEKQQTTTWFSTFSAEGSETWGFITKDKDGNTVEEVGGKSTARK